MTQEQEKQQDLIQLSKVTNGKTVTLVSIDAGQELRSRLAAMGLTPGVELTVIKHSNHGPFVIRVKNSKVVLGRGMTQKVLVHPLG